MLIIQYLIILIFIQVCHLLDQSVKYYGDQKSSNRYYTSNNSTSSLIDYMKTLYEQEKLTNKKNYNYNLIRALSPRLGMRIFDFLCICVILD